MIRTYSAVVKKISGLFLGLILISACLTGCGRKTAVDAEKSSEAEREESLVTLYYVDGNRLAAEEEKYQLRQPDSISNSLDEIMTVQQMPDDILYNSYSIDEYNNVSISVNAEATVTTEELLLNKAAIVSTVGQIDGIRTIRIAVSTLDGEVQDEEIYTTGSFFFYDETSGLINKGTAQLYLPNEEGDALKRILTDVQVGTEDSVEKCVVNLLISYGALPKDTVLNNIYVKSNICYVDFSKEFLNENGTIKSDIVVYSIVNTLTSLPNIDSVQILVAGQKESLYRGTVAIDNLLQFKGGLID